MSCKKTGERKPVNPFEPPGPGPLGAGRALPKSVLLCSLYVFSPAVLAVLIIVWGAVSSKPVEDARPPRFIALCLSFGVALVCAPPMFLYLLAVICRSARLARVVSDVFWVLFFLSLIPGMVLCVYILSELAAAWNAGDGLPVSAGWAALAVVFTLLVARMNILTARVMDGWARRLDRSDTD